MTISLSDCLEEDSRFLLEVIQKCPGSAPLAPLVRQAHEMAAMQSDLWRSMADQFRMCAATKARVDLDQRSRNGSPVLR